MTKNKLKGKLIIIDGSDGSGKTTQAKLLIEKLEENGQEVVFFDFPQYNKFYGKLIGRYLNGELGDLNSVNPYLISLPYALDRASERDNILKALEQEKIVLCNRYTCSNLAHQSAKFSTKKEQDEYVSWDEDLEYNKNKMPFPDLVIYLYIPHKIAQTLVDKKHVAQRQYARGKKRDIHESDSEFLKKSDERYLALTKEKGWKKINCVKKDRLLSIDEVHDLVWKKVQNILN